MKKAFPVLLIALFYAVCLPARSLYVDGFANILGNSANENTLLSYAQSHKITILLLYELHIVNAATPLNNTATNQPLANFIHKAKTQYNIQNIGAIGETSSSFVNYIDPYNNSRSLATEKIDIYNLEFEFWINSAISSGGYYCTTYLSPNGFACDSTGAFAFYLQELTAIKNLASANAHTIRTEAYVGWPNQNEAQQLQAVLDRILIHAYRVTPNDTYAYTRQRLSYFAANNANIDVSIIFSAEPNFMQNWLLDSTMIAAEQMYQNDFSNEIATWKSFIQLQEFTYFAYSFAVNIALLTHHSPTFPPIHLYPTPTTTHLNINIPIDFEMAQINVYDINGRSVKNIKAKFNKNQFQLNCSGWAKGTYILVLQNNNGEKRVGKFVVEN